MFVYSVNTNSGSYWHFITAGLSDLYGDRRVLYPNYEGNQSGFGIELTMRVRKLPKETDKDIPSWPVFIFHRIARYIFESGNRIMSGDDVPWGEAVDKKHAILTNFLTASDHCLKPVRDRS